MPKPAKVTPKPIEEALAGAPQEGGKVRKNKAKVAPAGNAPIRESANVAKPSKRAKATKPAVVAKEVEVAPKPQKITDNKLRKTVAFRNLSPDLQAILREKYPNGWEDVIKITRGENDFFHAVILETEDTNYLVKVDVKVDGRPKDDDDIVLSTDASGDDSTIIDTNDDDVDSIPSSDEESDSTEI